MQTKQSPTICDIAEQCGVSNMTVSRALSGTGRMRPQTREAILRAARGMGYEPNPHASRLRAGKSSNTIALFAPRLHSGIQLQRAQEIQGQLTRLGYEAPAYTHLNLSDSGYGYAREMVRGICRQRPAAIVYQTFHHDDAIIDELHAYQREGGIVVAYTQQSALECDHVIYDYADAGYQATRHLLDLGHWEIGSYNLGPNPDYCNGYFKAMGEAGIKLRDRWALQGTAQSAGGAEMARQFLDLTGRPTALLIVNDATANSAINHLIRAGVQVPKDVSIVAFDDTPLAPNCIVPLTVVRQPSDTIAHSVVDTLLDYLQNGYNGPSRRTVIRGEVIVRESTAAITGGFSQGLKP